MEEPPRLKAATPYHMLPLDLQRHSTAHSDLLFICPSSTPEANSASDHVKQLGWPLSSLLDSTTGLALGPNIFPLFILFIAALAFSLLIICTS